jgi:hypothetical protein
MDAERHRGRHRSISSPDEGLQWDMDAMARHDGGDQGKGSTSRDSGPCAIVARAGEAD